MGENGTGKSTLVEAVAMAFGLSPEGGSVQARHTTRSTESPLAQWLWLWRGAGASRWGFFLRAETMHGFYSYLEDNPGASGRGPVPPDEPRRVVPGDPADPLRLPRPVLPRRARGRAVVLGADRPGRHPARPRRSRCTGAAPPTPRLPGAGARVIG
ncbi:MAG TPA: hypothetical protein VFX52_02425 [Nocardioidaceae bacterium]|nr:hypothetical protein [Nocardioidaceae bacterium]